MTTRDGKKIEIKFESDSSGWGWNVRAINGGAVIASVNAPDKVRGRKWIKEDLKNHGII